MCRPGARRGIGARRAGHVRHPIRIAWPTRQPRSASGVDQEPGIGGRVRGAAMAFFRTRDRLGDRSVDQGARTQRRQQQQMQQQMIDREKAAAPAPQPAA